MNLRRTARAMLRAVTQSSLIGDGLNFVQRRLRNRAKARLDREHERGRLVDFVMHAFNIDPSEFSRELDTSSFRADYLGRKTDLKSGGLNLSGTTSDFDCESMYLVVRCLRPDVVVETGVLHGGFTAHILEALNQNDRGHLHSIDLPKPEGIGALVPWNLRDRWSLHVGDARDLLPGLLRDLGTIDLFHHDSLHTYAHQRWEYETAHSHLAKRGALTSHDVVHVRGFPNAFRDFCLEAGLKSGVFVNLGVALLTDSLRD